MPPRKHLVRLGQQGLPNLLRGPTTAAHRFEISQQMRPTWPSENDAVIDGKVGLYWTIKHWLFA